MMLSDVCLSRTSGLSRPRKTKVGTEAAYVTHNSDTTFKVKRSEVKVTGGGGILWRPPAQLVGSCTATASVIHPITLAIPLVAVRSHIDTCQVA